MKRLLFKSSGTSLHAAQKPTPSLAICLLMDFLGYATYSIPFLGEFLDVIWAPISALIFMRMFGGRKGILGGVFNFVEEILPGLDFIPTFTIMWLMQYFKGSKNSFNIRPASANQLQQF